MHRLFAHLIQVSSFRFSPLAPLPLVLAISPSSSSSTFITLTPGLTRALTAGWHSGGYAYLWRRHQNESLCWRASWCDPRNGLNTTQNCLSVNGVLADIDGCPCKSLHFSESLLLSRHEPRPFLGRVTYVAINFLVPTLKAMTNTDSTSLHCNYFKVGGTQISNCWWQTTSFTIWIVGCLVWLYDSLQRRFQHSLLPFNPFFAYPFLQ